MKLIQQNRHNPKDLEVAWMWLPTFIGENKIVLAELDRALAEAFPPPFELSNELLEKFHDFAIDWLVKKFDIRGLREYLLALRFVEG